MARRRGLIKAAVGLAVLGVVGVLFVRSARSVRAEPFKVSRDHLARWSLAIEPRSSQSGVLLALRPDRALASALFNDVFARTGESLNGPLPAEMPLILQSELDPRTAGALTPDALLALAREVGLEATMPQPRCMAHRRVSAPGITRQLYFVVFEAPAFDQFRRQVGQRLGESGAATFEPGAHSPVLIVAATDAAFSSWLPIRADVDKDCFAPIVVE